MAQSCNINFQESSSALTLFKNSLELSILSSKDKSQFLKDLKRYIIDYDILPALFKDLAVMLNDLQKSVYWTYRKWKPMKFTNKVISRMLPKPDTSKANPTTDLLEVDYTKDTASELFLSRAYGSALQVRKGAEQVWTNGLFEAIFLNRGTTGFGRVGPVTSNADINANIKAYLEYLYGICRDYIAKYFPDTILKDTLYTDTTVNFYDFISKVNPIFNNITPELLSNYARIKINRKGQDTIKAFNAFILLKNFDKFISLKLPDVVRVKPTEFGRMTLSNDKYALNTKADKMNASWRASEEIFVEDETSSKLKMTIETTPYYEYGLDTPKLDKFLLYGDFLAVIGLIKGIVEAGADNCEINNIAGELSEVSQNALTFLKQELGRTTLTLKDAIASIPLSPSKVMPLLMEILARQDITEKSYFSAIHDSEILNNSAIRNVIYSIYKGITDSENDTSLFSIAKNFNQNIYNDICLVVNSVYPNLILYYNYSDGKFGARYSKDMNTDTFARNVRSSISGLNRWLNIPLRNLIHDKYKITGINTSSTALVESTFKGITITIPISDSIGNVSELLLTVKPENSENQLVITATIGNKEVNLLDLVSTDGALTAIIQFVDDVLGLNLASNTPLFNAFQSLYINNWGEGLQGLITLAARTTALATVQSELMGDKPFDSKIKDIPKLLESITRAFGYHDPYISYDKNNKSINLIYGNDTGVINRLARAYLLVEGITKSTRISDSLGNDLSALNLSRLASNYETLWVSQCKRVDSATKGFSILQDGLIKGMARMHEATNEASVSKNHTKFNVKEFVTANFLIDYIQGLQTKTDSSQVFGNGVVGIIAAVISDKNFIPRLIVDLNHRIGERAIKDMNGYEILEIARTELGTAYEAIIDTINTDLRLVSTLIQQVTGLEIPLSVDNNFAEANEIVRKYNTENPTNPINLAKLIHDVVRQYNLTHRNDIINLIDQLHFTSDKKGNLKANSTLVALKLRMSTPENFANFINIKERQVAKDLIASGFSLQGDSIKFAGTLIDDNWIHNDKMVICKVNVNGQTINITSNLEYQRLLNAFSDFDLENANIGFELNPELKRWNALDYWLSLEFLMSTVGTHANHPAKGATSAFTNEGVDPELALIEEAARYNAQHKRNVSFTASMHAFSLDVLTGIPKRYTIANIGDVKDTLFNILGKVEPGVKPYDGAIFVDPVTVRLENNSLGAEKAGINKKTFVHAYEHKTASGVIIKTCAFGLTNALCRISPGESEADYEGYKNLMWKSMAYNWYVSTPGNADTNIFVDLTQGRHSYHDIYYLAEDGKFRKRSFDSMLLVENGDGTYSYSVEEEVVDAKGQILANTLTRVLIPAPKSNWEVYQWLFKGWNCLELGESGLQPSELSLDNLANAANECFYLKLDNNGDWCIANENGELFLDSEGEYITYSNGRFSDNFFDLRHQSDAYQPLKYSNINYLVTEGAIKQGGANMNDNTKYFTHELDWNISTFLPREIGIQLDKEHHADAAQVSMATQVMSACASMGYSTIETQKLYETLKNMTYIGLSSVKDKIDIFVLSGKGELSAINAILDIVINSIMESHTRGGSYEEYLKNQLQDAIDSGNLHPKVAFSGRMFRLFVSTITSTLTKAGIKAKLSGSLCVLNPSHGLYRMFGNYTWDHYGSRADLEEALKEYDSHPIYLSINGQRTPIGRIRLGRTYKLKTANGIESFKCDQPSKLYELRERISRGLVISVVEDITAGRDLCHYNVWFKVVGSESEYSMYDLASTRQLFTLREELELFEKAAKDRKQHKLSIERIRAAGLTLTENATIDLVKAEIKRVERELQKDLLVLSPGKTGTIYLLSNTGNIIPAEVRPETKEVESYELIMPAVFRTAFGLRVGDNVGLIQQDPNFFTNRLIENFALDALNSSDWTYVLKRANGKHVYILDKKIAQVPSLDFQIVDTQIVQDSLGLHRVMGDGSKMYDVSSKDDHFYSNGNVEIIVTDNPEFYAENLKYNSIEINDAIFGTSIEASVRLQEVVEAIGKSKNRSAKDWYTYITSPAEGIIQTEEDILTNVWANNNRIKNNDLAYLTKLGLSIHASFLQSLLIVAARIPAQSLQSFMPMQIVNFIEEDINNAYVSTALIWLLGSDFDVDAVTLMSYNINDSGVIQTASPFGNTSSKALIDASLDLPFPNGKSTMNIRKLTIDPIAIKEQSPNIELNVALNISESNKKLNLEFATALNQFISKGFTISNNTVEELNMLGLFLDFINAGWIDISEDPEALKVLNMSAEDFLSLLTSIQELYKQHNTYLNHVSEDIALSAAKNVILRQLYKIASDPVNLQEAQTSVDEATKDFKAISNSLPGAKALSKHTPGNVMNKIIAIFNNLVGKDGIAICAVGLKDLYAIALYANWILNYGSAELKARIAKSDAAKRRNIKEIAEWKKLWHPANIRALSRVTLTEVENTSKFIKELIQEMERGDNADDAALVLSALLSLATDNAKELALGNLNAGIDMLPLYVYGIIMGIDIKDLTSAMTSKLGLLMRDLRQGNQFGTERPISNFTQVFSYLLNGPVDRIRLGQRTADILTTAILNAHNTISIKINGTQIRCALVEGSEELLDKKFTAALAICAFAHSPLLSLLEKIKILESLRLSSDVVNSESFDWDSPPSEFLDFVEEYLYQVLTIYEKIPGYNDSNTSARERAKYFHIINPQGINDPSLFVDSVKRMAISYPIPMSEGKGYYPGSFGYNTIFNDLELLMELSQGAEEVQALGKILGINQGAKTKLSDQINFLFNVENAINTRNDLRNKFKIMLYNAAGGQFYNTNLVKDGTRKSKKDSKFDLMTFLSNEDYRKEQIKKYEGIKHAFNILDIVYTVPHYRGYLETAALIAKGCEMNSALYRFVRTYSKNLAKELKFTSSKDFNLFMNKLIDFGKGYIRRHFMLDNPLFRIHLDEGYSYSRNENGVYLKPINSPLIILLGTAEGDATFKYWMENEVIPNLKNNIMRDADGVLKKNSSLSKDPLIRALTWISSDRTVSHNSTFSYSLDINMSPRDDVGKATLEYYQGLLNASQLTYRGIPLKHLLWMYSQVVYNGKLGERTMTSLFDAMRDPIIEAYDDYVLNFDKNSDIIIDETVGIQEIIEATAPYRSMYRYGTKFIFGGTNIVNTLYLLESTLPKEMRSSEIEEEDLFILEDIMLDDDTVLQRRKLRASLYLPVGSYQYLGPDFVLGNVGSFTTSFLLETISSGQLLIKPMLTIQDGKIIDFTLSIKSEHVTKDLAIEAILSKIEEGVVLYNKLTDADGNPLPLLFPEIENVDKKSNLQITSEIMTYLNNTLDETAKTLLNKLEPLILDALSKYDELASVKEITEDDRRKVESDLKVIFTKTLNNGNYYVKLRRNPLTGELENISDKDMYNRIVKGMILSLNC